MDISSEKKNLRKKIRRLIESMPEKKRTEESDECCQKIIESGDFKNADTVLCYMATENEINTDMICTRSIREKKILALPKTIPGTNLMDFHVIDEKINLEKQISTGMWGIREPLPSLPRFTTEKILGQKKSGGKILALIPGVAFTKEGTRLGHGKGFYDIYLEKLIESCKEKKIGLTLTGICFSTQIFEILPKDSHDVIMDNVVFSSREPD